MKALEHINLLMSTVCLNKDKEGYIVNKLSDDEEVIEKPLLSKDKYKFVYPNNKNIDTKLMDFTDKKNPVVIGLPFNPITETVIGEELRSHPALRKQINYVISYAIYDVGVMMIHLINNDKKTHDIGTHLEMFLGSVKEGMNKRTKTNAVDETTISNWTKLITADKSQENIFPVSVITSKKNVKEGNQSFNRCATITFPLMEKLNSIPEDMDKIVVNGVNLRKKDLIVFKRILGFLLEGVDENYTIKEYSNDGDVPSYKSIMNLFLKVMDRIDKSGIKLKDNYDSKINIFYNPKREKLTLEQVESVNELLKELGNIPTDKDLVNFKVEEEVESIGNNKFSSLPKLESSDMGTVNIQPQPAPVQPTIPQATQQQYTPPVQQVQRPMDQADALNARFSKPSAPSNYYVAGNSNDPTSAMMNTIAMQNMPMQPMPMNMPVQNYQPPMMQQMPMDYSQPMQPMMPVQQNMQQGYYPNQQQDYGYQPRRPAFGGSFYR